MLFYVFNFENMFIKAEAVKQGWKKPQESLGRQRGLRGKSEQRGPWGLGQRVSSGRAAAAPCSLAARLVGSLSV